MAWENLKPKKSVPVKETAVMYIGKYRFQRWGIMNSPDYQLRLECDGVQLFFWVPKNAPDKEIIARIRRVYRKRLRIAASYLKHFR